MTNQPGDEIAAQESRFIATENDWLNDPDADEVEGYDLLKDDSQFQLVGVPFRITRATFHDGTQRKGVPYVDNFVSLELRVFPREYIVKSFARIITRRRSMDLPDTSEMAMPGEMLVVNDGSTGIYRQIVKYLAAKELIELPDGEEEGEKGDTIYDLPRSQWLAGADEAEKGFEIKLNCTRGLRFSEYTNDYTGNDKARTWYIA